MCSSEQCTNGGGAAGEGLLLPGGVGAGCLHTTSGGSVCGQGGCQALGLWIARGLFRAIAAEEGDE